MARSRVAHTSLAGDVEHKPLEVDSSLASIGRAEEVAEQFAGPRPQRVDAVALPPGPQMTHPLNYCP